MKRLELFVAFLLCFALGEAGLAVPPVKAVYGITGTAVSTRDGAPIPYCRLQVTEVNAFAQEQQRRFGGGPGGPDGPQRRQPEALEVEADVHGRFHLSVEKPGSWILSGSARDFRRQLYDAHDGFYAAIVLTPTSPVVEVTFRMQRDALVQGVVLDEAGEPVRNAQVAAEALADDGRTNLRAGGGRFAPRQAGAAVTDDRGRYELSGLAPGSYRIRVQAQPWYAQIVNHNLAARPSTASSPDPSLDVVYPTTWFPGAGDEAGAEVLQLSGGEERQADFHLSPLPSAHLAVPRPASTAQTEDGRPRPQRAAVLVRVSPAGGGLNLRTTGDGNTQQFGGLTPGLYEIHSFGADGAPDADVKQIRIPAGGSGTIDLSTAQLLTKVTLAVSDGDAGQSEGVTFTELSTGRVVNQNGFERFRRRNGPDAPASPPASNVSLAPGHWEVGMPNGSDAYLTGLSGAGLGVQGSTITVGEQPATLTLHFGSGRGEVRGTALAGGKPVEAAMVLLVPATLGDPGSLAQTSRSETNTDGSFTFRAVVPGKYILIALAHGWDVKWKQTEALLPYLTHGTPVEVSSKSKLQREIVAIEP